MPKMLINAYQYNSNQIMHIYSEDGVVKKEKVHFKPFLGTHAPNDPTTTWTDMHGNKVKIKQFDTITAMREWKKANQNLLEIFGDIDVVDMFVATRYQNDIIIDKTGLKIFNIDIEVFTSEGSGFPKATEALHPINAITINDMVPDTYTTFCYVDYIPENDNETLIRCTDELDLINKFIEYWRKEDPQIITGWYINGFDIPYLVNRINKILGPESAKLLSIDKVVKEVKKTDTTGKETIEYTLQGHIIWDYMELYKKYTQETRESYTLDNIASVELGDNKLEYKDEYDNLNDLYLKNPQKFISYNIKDTGLIKDLDYKLDYINVAMMVMHKAKCRADKIFGTIAPWDCIIYNKLLSMKILCPPNAHKSREDFVGGFVGEPIPGLHEWLEVIDIISSYPNQIRSYNLSPETAIPDNELCEELMDIKRRFTGIDICADLSRTNEIREVLQKHNVCFTSNGYFFDISKEGIIPKIFTELFALRKEYKKQCKEHKKAGRDREAKIADLYQYTIKILLNSGYGALANNFSRYFDIRIGEAITSNGQVACKGMIKTLQDELNIKVVYADTDSNFIALDGILKDRFKDNIDQVDNQTKLDFLLKYNEKCIEPTVNGFFQRLKENMNMRELTIFVEAECIADVTLFTAKKRYIMNKVWDEGTFHVEHPKRKIRGVEIVRSSTPKLIREKLKECVDLIFTTKSNDTLIDFIDAFRIEFKKLPIETISFPRSVTMKDYVRGGKGIPIGVNAAFSYNDYLKKLKLDKKYISVADGDKIKFCYIKQPNHVGSHVIGFLNKLPSEMNGTFQIDYNLQFQKAFLAPLDSIFQAINWKIERKQSLEDFDDCDSFN
jgi:DNA polymerase elongation subunit (family B)